MNTPKMFRIKAQLLIYIKIKKILTCTQIYSPSRDGSYDQDNSHSKKK